MKEKIPFWRRMFDFKRCGDFWDHHFHYALGVEDQPTDYCKLNSALYRKGTCCRCGFQVREQVHNER